MTCFTGIWVPLVTPFHHGEIDFPALQTIARKMAQAGVAGLVVCGTTGEAAALTELEQLAVLESVLKAAPGCPVVMGLAGNNLRASLGMLKQLEAMPIAGLLVPPPYYIRPSQAGIVEYFETLADAAPAPLILYNIPYRTGVTLERQTIDALARHERVVAIKDCGGSAALTMDLIRDPQLKVLAGEDEQIFSTLCLGGAGAIAASAHIRPDLFVRMAQLAQSGQLDQARKIFYDLLPMIRLLFAEPNPAPVKEALALMGLMRNELRSPMKSATPELSARLKRELTRLDCL
ncbi:MAG: 4-hydroxy-tetrahydrodipicolinate synthase [Burkholderiaceae bacterium]|nr:4-hydroxy-tetrahydrodipicolinate synthase [Burkholderiaceae bacterium]